MEGFVNYGSPILGVAAGEEAAMDPFAPADDSLLGLKKRGEVGLDESGVFRRDAGGEIDAGFANTRELGFADGKTEGARAKGQGLDGTQFDLWKEADVVARQSELGFLPEPTQTADKEETAGDEQGRVAGAGAGLDRALNTQPPEDPVRTNPALTVEHAKQVEEVRRKLYEGGGNYDLGKFKEAKQAYEDVLRVDPYNKAARRGMERVNAAESDYYKAAYDSTRAELLAQVDAAWEEAVPADS
jgi:hypothetical protein